MKFAAVLFLLPVLWCGGCATLSPRPLVDPMATPDWRATYEQTFRRQYESFEVKPATLPTFERSVFSHVAKRLPLTPSGGQRLELVLGSRRNLANYHFRTASRYRVLHRDGRLLASAESTLSFGDVESTPEIIVLTDAATQTYFIAEEQSWATQRYILLQAVPVAGGARPMWKVSYVRLPKGNSIEGDNPHLLGWSAGRLYLEKFGHFYAFPLEALEPETDLVFTIG